MDIFSDIMTNGGWVDHALMAQLYICLILQCMKFY